MKETIGTTRTLNKKLAVIQTELKAKKSSYNSFGKYYFRKAEDILEAVKPFLLREGVSVRVDEELVTSIDTPPIIQSTATISDGENSIKATAIVGVDLNADSTNSHGKASQIVNKAKAKINMDQMKKALDFVKDGGSVDAIKSKYELTKDQEAGLIRVKISN